MTERFDVLRELPGTAQTRGETDVIDVDSETINLPAVRPDGSLAIPDPDGHMFHQMLDLVDATNWAKPWKGRWRWASDLPQAIREADPSLFRALIVVGLAHGFGGQVVTAGEFEVALLEVDAQLAGAL